MAPIARTRYWNEATAGPHHHFPHIIDCQPIDAEQFLEKAGFRISAQAELETWTIPVIALVAEVSP